MGRRLLLRATARYQSRLVFGWITIGAWWLIAPRAAAVDYTISTYAGIAPSTEPTRVETARLYGEIHISWTDADGLLYTDRLGGFIRRIEVDTGQISPLFRLPDVPNDDPAGALLGVASLSPDGIVGDQTGNLYVSRDHCIRKIDRAGNLTGVAGKPGSFGAADGVGAAARFHSPTGLALNSAGTRLFVADSGNDLLREVNTVSGAVTTVAGQAYDATLIDGVGDEARFNYPYDLALYGDDELYVADLFNHAIRLVTPSTRRVVTFAGSARGESGAIDGIGTAARFDKPTGIVVDTDGTLYVADEINAAIRKVDRRTAQVSTLAGSLHDPGYADGPATSARFNGPVALALDSARRQLYVAEVYNELVRRIDLANVQVTTAVGVFVGRDGPLALARFTFLHGVTAGPDGALFVADSFSATIRKISPAGVVTTVAGKTYVPGEVDGPNGDSRLDGLSYLASDRGGNIYFTSGRHTIRRLSPDGRVTTIAGRTDVPGSADGSADQARFNAPFGIAIDRLGNLFIADINNNTIRKLSAAGVVSTVAGMPKDATAVDGIGHAARFIAPKGIAIDAADNLYVTDAHAIRKVSPAGMVTTIAGSAMSIGFRDGVGSAARFSYPSGLAVDENGTVFVADTTNRVIRRISADGDVSTVAGRANSSGNEDGVAGRFSTPVGIALASNGTLFVTDWDNCTVRAVTSSPVSRLTNLSVRANTGGDEQTLIAGFSITGTAGKRVLVRCVGPTLAQFGVTGVLNDPVLRLFSASSPGWTMENDNWGGDGALRNLFAEVGAFPLGANDAALTTELASGAYTAHAATNGDRGAVLLEVYDADPLTAPSRLWNLSVRGASGQDSTLIVGFTVRGDVNRTLLLRGLGPALRPLGVTGTLDNPELVLYASDGTVLGRNDDWANQPDANSVSAAASSVGAVALTAGARDAALLVSLRPGSYTVQLSGPVGDTGIGLVEVYEVP